MNLHYTLLCLSLWLPNLAWAGQVLTGPKTKIALGSGLDVNTGQIRGPCVEGSPSPNPSPKSLHFQLFSGQSSDEIFDQQQGYGSGQIDFWLLGAKARSEFIIRNGESRKQASMIWNVEYRQGSLNLLQPRWNAFGLSVLKDRPKVFSRLCGDQFVIGLAKGAQFFLSATLIFQNQEKYSYFKTRVSVSGLGGLIKKDKSSIQEMQDKARGAYLAVEYLQQGGDSFALDTIGASQASVCPIDQVEPCLDRLAALYRYAFGADGFRTHAETVKLEDQATLWSFSSSYDDAGLILTPFNSTVDSPSGFIDLSNELFLWSRRLQEEVADSSSRAFDPSQTQADRAEQFGRRQSLLKESELLQNIADRCLTDTDEKICRQRIQTGQVQNARIRTRSSL